MIMRNVKLVKKFRNILMICLVAMMLVACSDSNQNKGVSNGIASGIPGIGSETVMKEKTPEEIMVEEWLERVNTEPNYERDFDINTINEEEAALYMRFMNSYNLKVLDRDGDKMLVGLTDEKNVIRLFVGFDLQDNGMKLFEGDEIREWYDGIACSECKGKSQVVIGTHTENRLQGCSGCGGAGFTYSQFFDGMMWQQQQITCGICAGTGWQTGPSEVDDYAECKACNGLGVTKEE